MQMLELKVMPSFTRLVALSRPLNNLLMFVLDLLAPLTRPADLPDHPTLSLAFTSTPLTELTRNAREMWQKEQASLWKMKKLLQKLSGDQIWVPSEMMETAGDLALFDDGRSGYREHVHEKASLDIETIEKRLAMKAIAAAESALDESLDLVQGPEIIQTEASPEGTPVEDDVAMIEALAEDTQASEKIPAGKDDKDAEKPDIVAKTEDGIAEAMSDIPANQLPVPISEGELKEQEQAQGVDDLEKESNGMELTAPEIEDMPEDQEEDPAPRRMRTRAQAQAASDENTISGNRSLTPESNNSYVHPYFMPPLSAHPDRDMGLPAQEAEDTRRLLQLYIQKQEEVCRGARRLYDGLMKAESMRAEVYKWAKADGHIGEMSDGEDWYDKDEWGLTEDLKKGQDEEEEDAATTAKKTRTRRQ